MPINNKLIKERRQHFNASIKDYDKLVNWDEIFPKKGRPDLRKKPTRHQKKVLNKLNELLEENGGAGRFHPLRQSRKRDIMQAATGTEQIFKGYFAPTEMHIVGDWAVLDIEAAKVQLYYKGFPKTVETEQEAEQFTRDALQTRPRVKISNVGLSNKGGQFDMVGIEQDYELPDKARATFLKYAGMHARGEKRDNYHGQPAAHPRDWMTGIAFTRLL